MIADTFTITPTLLNEFRFGYARNVTNNDTFPFYGKAVAADLGLTGLNLAGPNAQGRGPIGSFDFSDGTGFTPVGHGTEVSPYDQVVEFTDNVSWIKGRHTMKFGADVWFDHWSGGFSYGSDELGAYLFTSSAFSGNAYVDFLLGLPFLNDYIVPPRKVALYTNRREAFYAQDEFRVTSRLTLNFGLRYAILPHTGEDSGSITTFLRTPAGTGTFVLPTNHVPLPNDVLFEMDACPGSAPNWNGVGFATPQPCTPIATPYGTSAVKVDYGDWQPRFSLAWRPFGNNKTVFRGGIGIFTIMAPSSQTWGFSANTVSNVYHYNYNGPGNPPNWTWPQAFAGSGLDPSLVGQYYTTVGDALMKDPRMTQWSVSIEREMGMNWILHLNYIGSSSSGLVQGSDLNQLPPTSTPYDASKRPYLNFSTILFESNIAFSNYEAFNPSIEHRFSKGFMVQANYTWAKSLGTVSNENATGYNGSFGYFGSWVNNRFDLPGLRGNDPGTRRHRFLVSAIYQLPFGKGKTFLTNSNPVVDGILGGWQLSTVSLVETGPYLTPLISAAYSQDNLNEFGRGIFTVRPDRIANGNLSNPSAAGPWWDINAFAPPPAGAGREGNAGIGILEAPGTIAIAGGLSKTFLIKERARVRFEATFTNLPNHPNFAPPPRVINDVSTFGVIVTSQTAENSGNRTGQLSLRIDF
jgi:hypothetical protein